jgi:hypothetical protein
MHHTSVVGNNLDAEAINAMEPIYIFKIEINLFPD